MHTAKGDLETTQAEDEDLSMQPQATSSAYESKGGNIIETLEDMQDKAQSSLSDARKAEMESKHAFDMLEQSLETEISTMNKRMGAAQVERSSAEEAMHTAKGDLETTQAALKTDTTYLEE